MTRDVPSPYSSSGSDPRTALLMGDDAAAPADAPSYSADEQDAASLQRQRLLQLLRGRLWWGLPLALVLAVGLGVLGWFSVKPMYMSLATLKINVEDRSVVQGGNLGGALRNVTSFVEEQMRLIESGTIVDEAMESDTWTQQGLSALTDEGLEAPSSRQFSDDLSVVPAEGQGRNVFHVVFNSRDPVAAQAGTNAVVRTYVEHHRDTYLGEARRQLELKRRVLQSLEDDRQGLVDRIAQIVPPERHASVTNRLSQYEENLGRLQMELIAVESQLGAVPEVPEGDIYRPGIDPPRGKDYWIGVNATLQAMQAEIDFLNEELARLRNLNIGENHQSSRRIQAEITTLEDRQDAFVALLNAGQPLPTSVSSPREILITRRERILIGIAELQQQVEDINQQLSRVRNLERELDSLDNRIEINQSAYDTDLAFMSVMSDEMAGLVSVEHFGTRMEDPSNGGARLQRAGMGGIAGFGMGMGVVLLVGLMDRRVRHASDAKVGQAQVRMLGVLPTLPDDMSDPHQAEQASHSVHHIRTLLQIGRGAQRVFAITSPTPGSGKSSLTAALGLSFAASDNKVLLIDCDLVGGGLTRRIGSVVHEPLERMLLESGLLDEQQLTLASTESARRRMPLEQVLLEEGYVEPDQLERLARRQRDTTLGILDACEGKPLRACVADTGIRNVKILPVGSARPQDAGTLSPAALRRLIADAREAYDVVLLDTGPVLGSLEAAMAAAEADASVLIVSRGDQKSLVMRAMEHLRSVGATMAGVVFNHALDADINSTDYASVVSVDRRVDATRSTPVADPGAAARFGPLGSAVASYGSSRDLELRSSSPVAVTNGTSSNGNGHHG